MYMGLAVHKRVYHETVMNEDGRILKRKWFSNDPR
jgi:hypothetical protein